MLTLNGTKLLTERFPNNETKVKDFENAIIDGQNILEFKYVNDEDLVTLMFAKKRIDEFFLPRAESVVSEIFFEGLIFVIFSVSSHSVFFLNLPAPCCFAAF